MAVCKEKTDIDASNLYGPLENDALIGSKNANEDMKSANQNGSDFVLVNNVEHAWHEKRRAWIGHRSQRLERSPKEPIIDSTATYEELLLSAKAFTEPIPLAEMVDFLVDIWHGEELYD